MTEQQLAFKLGFALGKMDDLIRNGYNSGSDDFIEIRNTIKECSEFIFNKEIPYSPLMNPNIKT